jgi:AcrR family transcriptional regulator
MIEEQLEGIRKGRKFDQVLRGAREIFLRDGFEGASVDDISREAGVSKATLYNYFPDKRLLFLEICRSECAQQAERSMQAMDFSRPPECLLKEVAHQLLDFLLSGFGIKIFKIIVAESDRFPEIGQYFYKTGHMLYLEVMTNYLIEATKRGELQIDDVELAANQFGELCKADLWPKLVFGLQTSFSDVEKSRIADNAVLTFMARFGVPAQK